MIWHPRPSAPAADLLEALEVEKVGGLRLLLHSRFTPQTLSRHLAVNPGLSWRHVANGQYVVGGYWRRRPEIACVVELSPGPHRRELVDRLVAAAQRIGCDLVLAEIPIEPRDAELWRAAGFAPVDRIVEYEKIGAWSDAGVTATYLRPYKPDDLRPLLALEERSFPWLWRNSTAELAQYGEADESEIWVAAPPEAGGTPIGYVGLTIRGAHGHLDRLAVDPDWRRRGIGAALVSRALERYAETGVRRITLTTQVDNARAQPLYARFGFRPTRNQLTIHGKWLGRPRDRTP